MSALRLQRLEALERRERQEETVPRAIQKGTERTLYESLPQEVVMGPVGTVLRLRSSVERPHERVEHHVHELMGTSKKTFDTKKAFDSKLRHKVLLLENPVKLGTSIGVARGKAYKRKVRSEHFLSSRKRRNAGLYRIEKEKLEFDRFCEFNRLWEEYAGKLRKLGKDPTLDMEGVESIGARLSVIKCNDPRFVGRDGIVIQVTKKTFVLLDKDGRSTRVPRAHTRVLLHLNGTSIEWDAEEFCKGTTIA